VLVFLFLLSPLALSSASFLVITDSADARFKDAENPPAFIAFAPHAAGVFSGKCVDESFIAAYHGNISIRSSA
jgi:hypothetical protein